MLINGVGYPQPGALRSPPDWIGPPLSMIRFGGWNGDFEYPTGWSYFTRFQHRWPSAYTNGKNSGTTGPNPVSVMEVENAQAAAAGITAWGFDFYLPAAIVEPDDPRAQSEALQAELEAFLQTSNIGLMKFWVNLIVSTTNGISYTTTSPYKYFTTSVGGRPSFSSYVNTLTQHPQYLRVRKGPVIGLFSSGGTGPAMTAVQWDDFLTPMGGRSSVFVVQTSGSNADFTTYSCDARLKYGIQNLTAGQGHKPFTTSSDADKIYWTQALLAGETRIAQFNLANDGRALDAAAGTRTWCDMPTHWQTAEHVRGALGVSGSVMAIGVWNELGEEGPVPPTAQDGDKYLRAIRQERSGVRPATETYKVNAANADTAIVASNGAGWTYVSPFTATSAYHDADYVVSSTAGDYKELINHPRLQSCGFYADKGPDCGILELWKNGVLDQTIDCYAATPSTAVLVGTVTFSTVGDNSARMRVTGTKNASSSSAQIRFDTFEPTYRL